MMNITRVKTLVRENKYTYDKPGIFGQVLQTTNPVELDALEGKANDCARMSDDTRRKVARALAYQRSSIQA